MHTYRLRVELADRPGQLARVTSVIADAGANISSVDIHEVEGPTALDEIVVQVPEDWEPGRLAEALAASGAGALLSAQRVKFAADAVVDVLRACSFMVTASAEDRDAECLRALVAMSHGASAWLSDVEGASSVDAGRMALERGTPIVMRAQPDPETPRPCWLLAVPDDDLSPSVVAFVTRPLSLPFSATESARVEVLLRMRRRIAELAGGHGIN